jgi:predicted Fe-S protein YdhL (DUF1289 family)
MAVQSDDPPVNPCVRNCCLDERHVCMGCGRSLQEILDWHAADAGQRRAILECASARLALRPPTPSGDAGFSLGKRRGKPG